MVGEDGEVDSSLADRHMAGARAAALGARGVVEGSLVAARGVHGEDTPGAGGGYSAYGYAGG